MADVRDRHGLTTPPEALDASYEQLIEEYRARTPTGYTRRERWSALAFGGGFLASALAVAVVLPWHRSFSPLAAVLLVVVYGAVSRITFEIGTGLAHPAQLILVPMFFALPAPVVPLAVAAGLLLGDLSDAARGRMHIERTVSSLPAAWHALGPAIVLTFFAAPEPRWSDWPIYLAALGTHFALEAVVWMLEGWLSLGHAPLLVLRFVSRSWVIDVLLAPVGLALAFAEQTFSLAFLLALPLAALLALLGRERRVGVERALELARAYRRANEEARRDPLTGLGNRLAWEEALTRRPLTERPASVLLIDLNDLKRANDAAGHHVGDELIRALAAVVTTAVRDNDVVARIGGDELAVLLVDTDEDACAAIAARLESLLAGHAPIADFTLSASVGYATSPPTGSLAEAQRLADNRMYERKLGGRMARAAS